MNKITLDNEYEYREVYELEGINRNYIRIPRYIIINDEMQSHRVALFTYLSIYKGYDHDLYFTIPSILDWAGYANDARENGLNDKFINTLDYLNCDGYITYYKEPSRTGLCKVEFNMQQVFDECACGRFAIIYMDEIKRIMKYRNDNKKDTYLRNVNILLVFSYLRLMIPRRPNKLKIENRNPEGIAQRREALIEAYATNYKDIAEDIGLSAQTVAKAVKVLEKLKLIVVDESFRIKKSDDSYFTPYTLFANYEKRDGAYLVFSGLEYARSEMERKAEIIRRYNSSYCINTEKRTRREIMYYS